MAIPLLEAPAADEDITNVSPGFMRIGCHGKAFNILSVSSKF